MAVYGERVALGKCVFTHVQELQSMNQGSMSAEGRESPVPAYVWRAKKGQTMDELEYHCCGCYFKGNGP